MMTTDGAVRKNGFAAGIVLGMMLSLAVAAFSLGENAAAVAADSGKPVASAVGKDQERITLRIAGEELLAATVIVPLARNHLERDGAYGIRIENATAPYTTKISGLMADGYPVAILVRSSSTEDGFRLLRDGKIDIALAGRPPTPDEARAMPWLGENDVKDAKSSVAIARTAIVMAAHPSNPIRSITFDQLRGIYAGKVTDWAELGIAPGKIRVLTMKDGLATRNLFDSVVMGATPVAPSIERAASFGAMRAALRADPNAIGYMSITDGLKRVHVHVNERVDVSPPDSYELASGDYPLTQILRLYRNPHGGNPEASVFFRQALSAASEFIIMSAGFSQLRPQLILPKLDISFSAEYKALTTNALRVSTTIHFADGSAQIDAPASHDLDVLATYLRSLQLRGDHLIHIAFSEDTGDPARNKEMSQQLGEAVAKELDRRLVVPGEVVSLGATKPLASDLTPVGRRINRRVETWIKP